MRYYSNLVDTGIPYSSCLECRSGEPSGKIDWDCVVVSAIAPWQEHSYAGSCTSGCPERKVQCSSSTISHSTGSADWQTPGHPQLPTARLMVRIPPKHSIFACIPPTALPSALGCSGRAWCCGRETATG